jgi:hypothetical protein
VIIDASSKSFVNLPISTDRPMLVEKQELLHQQDGDPFGFRPIFTINNQLVFAKNGDGSERHREMGGSLPEN